MHYNFDGAGFIVINITYNITWGCEGQLQLVNGGGKLPLVGVFIVYLTFMY